MAQAGGIAPLCDQQCHAYQFENLPSPRFRYNSYAWGVMSSVVAGAHPRECVSMPHTSGTSIITASLLCVLLCGNAHVKVR